MRLVMIAGCHVREKQIVNKGRRTNDGRGGTKEARVLAGRGTSVQSPGGRRIVFKSANPSWAVHIVTGVANWWTSAASEDLAYLRPGTLLICEIPIRECLCASDWFCTTCKAAEWNRATDWKEKPDNSQQQLIYLIYVFLPVCSALTNNYYKLKFVILNNVICKKIKTRLHNS